MFRLISKNKPAGDQPKAIKLLTAGLKNGYQFQTLLGVTGSGKTFTIANVINTIQKPTLVIAHNKTLAAQLTNELRELFPYNSVNYFVSYYDYYQPEAYLPHSDTYIAKEAMINDEIDKLRHAATSALLTRDDVIIVASVSCIYGLGAPELYAQNILQFKIGEKIKRNELIKKLVELYFTRTNSVLKRGTFRVRGDNWEIMPPGIEKIYNLEIKNETIQNIYEIDPVLGFQPGLTPKIEKVFIPPAKHFITTIQNREKAMLAIEKELKEQIKKFEKEKKFLEAERIERRTKADLAMLREIGYCNGIENYSRHLSGRKAGEPPETLLDYFPKDFLTVIDESHVTIPQLKGMYAGDASRKKTLIEYGFRLPSALDNRPLKFDEFIKKIHQTIFMSATPGPYEKKVSSQIVEQIIRPTGLVDPQIIVKPVKTQIKDLLQRIEEKIKDKKRVLATTLTKKMAENLSSYLLEKNIKVMYLHSDVDTLDRIKILTKLRKGEIEVIVGVNLLREGLDLPEVALVAILDADKEGFLRSETSLIQTIGRASRNVSGEVIIYADHLTQSIQKAILETERRRKIQIAYNQKHHIQPKTIQKEIKDILPTEILNLETKVLPHSRQAIEKLIQAKEKEMKEATKKLDFELAIILRDEIKILKQKIKLKRN